MENKVLSLKDLKNLQEDNEIDLSARQLVEVPKPLYLLPRITNVDLGGNKLAFLSNELCTMTRLVKLDLGNNKIHNLPHDFGNLVKLEHLNLFNNEIEELPLSVANLKALKWLDLKKNPLETNLEKAAGNCGNEKECRQAATNVVAFVEKQRSILNSQTEKQKKVLDKIHEKKVIEEQRKGKKGNQKKEDAGKGSHYMDFLTRKAPIVYSHRSR